MSLFVPKALASSTSLRMLEARSFFFHVFFFFHTLRLFQAAFIVFIFALVLLCKCLVLLGCVLVFQLELLGAPCLCMSLVEG